MLTAPLRPSRPLGPRRAGPLALGLALALTTAGCFGARKAAERREAEEAASEAQALLEGQVAQSDADEYTAYELLDPRSSEIDVRYEVSVTTPGATSYFNVLRPDAVVRDMRAVDLYTGEELVTEVVTGTVAREQGHPLADARLSYLAIRLARPVPERGQTRLSIEKTYKQPSNYFLEGEQLVFARWLTIERNSVLLPAGYELESCNYPAQVFTEDDGRLRVSLTKTVLTPMVFVLRARPLGTADEAEDATAQGAATEDAAVEDTADAAELDASEPSTRLSAFTSTRPRVRATFPELAREDRELLFDLESPEKSTFRVQRDFTESRPDAERFVAADTGRVRDVRATVLDTGEKLRTEVTNGQRARAQGWIADEIDPDAELVVVHYPPAQGSRSLRMRVEEQRRDPERFGIDGDELVWMGELGSRIGTVVLPRGWYLVANSVPAVVMETGDGRVRLDYRSPRPDGTEVIVRARRRP
jgi:hypothetical protein